MERILKYLAAGHCSVAELADGKGVLLERDAGRRMRAPKESIAGLLTHRLALLRGGMLELTPEGRAKAQRIENDGDPFAGQHRDIAAETMTVHGERQQVLVNHNESPLAALARRRDKAGAPFLSAGQYRAGERLRSDYSRGMIMPRLGANWEADVSSGRRDGGRGIADLTDAALGARRRVEAAIEAVGPELSGVLIDVCCFLKGLELVESERGWPARSAKIVLRAALSVLSRHYEPPSPGRPVRLLHWGVADYRPVSAL